MCPVISLAVRVRRGPLPYNAEADSGADGDETEGRVGAAGPEPQFFAGQCGDVVGDDDRQAGAVLQRGGEVDVAPPEEGTFPHDRPVDDDATDRYPDAVQ